jgi:hypothetical protein
MNYSNPYLQLVQQQQQQNQLNAQQQMTGGVQTRPMQFQARQDEPPPPPPEKKQGGPMAMMGGMGGGGGGSSGGSGGGFMGMSDENSKKEIQRLSSANQALTKALGAKVEYPDVNAPSSGGQALGVQRSAPSHADFADTPAANRVAGQNVGLSTGGQAPPMQQQPAPQAQQQGSPFAFSRSAPDLSALDEAYRKLGASQGT